MDTPRPARQRRKAIRPRQLLDAAVSLFVEKGCAATRTDEVAALAGVCRQHRELLAALFEAWWDRVAESSAGALHKIVLSEARNFPELARSYADEVMVPAHRLFANSCGAASSRSSSARSTPRQRPMRRWHR